MQRFQYSERRNNCDNDWIPRSYDSGLGLGKEQITEHMQSWHTTHNNASYG